MDTHTTTESAGTCGQSSDSADNLRTEKAPKPRSIIVSFSDVGRAKRSWSKAFKQGISIDAIAREAQVGGGLMSSIVDAELSDGGGIGHIIVGGWRVVGTFSITPA